LTLCQGGTQQKSLQAPAQSRKKAVQTCLHLGLFNHKHQLGTGGD